MKFELNLRLTQDIKDFIKQRAKYNKISIEKYLSGQLKERLLELYETWNVAKDGEARFHEYSYTFEKMNKLETIFYFLPEKERKYICGSENYCIDYNYPTDIQFGDEDFCVAQLSQRDNIEKDIIIYWLTLITHPNHRQEGLATILFEQVKNYIQKRYNSIVKIYSKVNKDNIPSIKWHKKMGFEYCHDESNQEIYSLTLNRTEV